MFFKRIKVDTKGGVYLRLFRRDGEKKVVPVKEGATCELCGFVAKTESGLRLHKMRKHK